MVRKGKKGMRKASNSESNDEFDWEPHHQWNAYVESTYYQALEEQQQQNYEIHYDQPQDRDSQGISDQNIVVDQSPTHDGTVDVKSFQSEKRTHHWGTDHGWNHHVQQDTTIEVPRAVAGTGKRFRRHPRGLKVSREEVEEDLSL